MCSLSLLCVIAVAPQSLVRGKGDGRLHVTLLDVGQGDAVLVTFPNGRTLLVDAGGLSPQATFDIGDRIVGPALRARGIRRLDYLAITHGDPDHIGGAQAVVRDFAPREVWVGVPVAGHGPAALLREGADAMSVRATWRTLQRSDRMEIGEVSLLVLHPPRPDWERQRVRNDDSLVLELRMGDFAVLLTGDIGRAVERDLLPMIASAGLFALKVPHHGSATSSSEELLSAVRPTVALIGVGRSNPYGHPAPAVLERYRGIGAEVFQTDRDGQVNLSSDGIAVEVSTYSGRRASKDNTKDTKAPKD
ncbi:MAG: MBL fold metallo-hydrolase [Acidobacteria bacterium]|nr:MBL fold metallo-hydrolase [Acidobacteriota bacterium]